MNFIDALFGAKPPRRRHWSTRVYVKLERMPDLEEENPRMVFQAIDAAWFDKAAFPQDGLTLRNFRGARVFLIEISIQSIFGKKLVFFAGANDVDGGWSEFLLSRPTNNLEAALVRDTLGAEAWRQEILEVNSVSEPARAVLNSVFRLPETWMTDLDEALSRLSHIGDPHVVAYDVGQGAAAGLHHQQGWVEIYFDLGGGVTSHAGTYPSGLRFCFSRQPLIVLSHWHFDHWVSATLHDMRALESIWIVPEQTIGPFQLVLALAIWSRGGRVVVWPATSSSILTIGPVSIGLCTGASRNESGLAMLIKTYAGNVLLTGDCGYRHLPDFWPGMASAPLLLGLVAPHHGGKTSPLAGKFTPAPKNAWSKLVYTVGDPNEYDHVRGDVEAAHLAAGWTSAMTRKTWALRPAQGHVWLTPAPFIPPCFGAAAFSCSLRPAQ